jgi:hypothetical protein
MALLSEVEERTFPDYFLFLPDFFTGFMAGARLPTLGMVITDQRTNSKIFLPQLQQ